MSEPIRCPECDRTWHVQGNSGGEMLCPYCMTRIPLNPAVRDLQAPGPEAGAEETAPVEQTAPVKPVAEVVASPQPARPAADTQVVCPRCKLHFRPRGRAVERTEARKTVLVVDDLEYFRQIAKDALEPTCRVQTAATTAQAREILTKGGVDLLVLDLSIEGKGAGHRLLSELGPKPCPILIYTAQDESEMYGENWEKLQQLGADDLVIKGMQVAESLSRKASALLGLPMDDEDTIG